jgi:hypothetical protein
MIEEEGNNSGSVKAPKLVTQLVTTQKILKYVVGKHTAPITAETGAHGGSMVLAIRETPPDCVTRGIAHRGQTMPARLSLWTHLRLHGRPALGPLGGTTSDAAIAINELPKAHLFDLSRIFLQIFKSSRPFALNLSILLG